jgi:hypothetical protein
VGGISLLVLSSADSRAPGTGFPAVAFLFSIPLLPLTAFLQQYSKNSFAIAVAAIPAYWITIGIGAGLLLAVTMRLGRAIKIAVWLALLAFFPLVLWSFLLSKRIAQGGVLWIFPDSLYMPLVATCVVLTVLFVGYTVFIVARAFYSGSSQPAHLVILCVSWILGTFALHCWVLLGLTSMPAWTSVKRDSGDQSGALNGMLTGYAGSVEDRARQRAAMQMDMPRGTAVPTVEQKLAIALRMEENQHGYLTTVATMADNAERLTARRAWVSWATTAFTPVVFLALFALRTKRLARTSNATPPA